MRLEPKISYVLHSNATGSRLGGHVYYELAEEAARKIIGKYPTGITIIKQVTSYEVFAKLKMPDPIIEHYTKTPDDPHHWHKNADRSRNES